MFDGKYILISAVAAIMATIAATVSNGLGWPVWAMFIGWVAFFFGKSSLSGAAATFGCLAIGLVLGNVAGICIGLLAPKAGFWAISPVVFVVATVVVSLRGVPVLNNIPAYFLGLITFFAAYLPLGVSATVSLILPTALGVVAAFCTGVLQKHMSVKAPV
ncbi:DUF1097 domain-containing protein [Marinomonas transparens]|uniref:DUF1097 domain-containing protein n=1 Tax=Marinomonas transparens TaxID=2795388 RepID=A0A934N5J5_9GAMM|nr:DUF1097 domain-containing protein [Marinomonas transparens]MBJ7537116.1 DUF1097 domain-containing protein [Marinomonas transparens]